MINIVFDIKNDILSKVEITGHANFSTNGKDIVCAGVSVLVRTFLLFIKKENEIIYKEKRDNGKLIINIEKISDPYLDKYRVASDILILGLKSLEKEYQTYVKIELNIF